MNPFVVFIILAPLAVAVLLWVIATVYTINCGLSGGVLVMHVVFGGLSIALVYLLVRTSRGPLLDDKEIQHLDTATKQRLTNSTLAMIFFTVLMCLAFGEIGEIGDVVD